MATITFYRQARQDGGVRTGIEVDDNTVLARFETGSRETDPSLIWFVDVHCTGKSLPKRPEDVRTWLIENEEPIVETLESLAGDLEVGVDVDSWPLRKDIHGLKRGIRGWISCSAVGRLNARGISKSLRNVAKYWKTRVRNLQTDSENF